MPSRRLKCVSCEKEKICILSSLDEKRVCECGGTMEAQILVVQRKSVVKERVSKYLNKSLELGAKEKSLERGKEHMREHEMHDIIARFGIENLKNHPLIKGGRIRRKGE